MEDILQSIKTNDIDKIRNKLAMWKNKSLPLTTIMIFIKSNIFTMYVYQSSIVLVSKRVINDIERIFKQIPW